MAKPSLVTRLNTYLRIALTGPTNAGKTYSGLILAYGIVEAKAKAKGLTPTPEEIWAQIGLIDTERERGRMYASRTDLPFPTGQFYYTSIEPPYHPDKYVAAQKEMAEAVGPDGVIVTDSLSHAWNYTGGINDINADIASQGKGNSYTAWQETNKIQNAFVDSILSPKVHTISTMRSKMDYVLEVNANNKAVPRPVGLKPIQRDDLEFEFDITLMLDNEHKYRIIKDITFLKETDVDDYPPITPDLGHRLIEWLETGADPVKIREEERLALIKELQERAAANPQLVSLFKNLHKDTKSEDLTRTEAAKVLEQFNKLEGGK